MAACGGSAGDPETNRKRAEEMVALAPTIIVAFGSSAVAALLQATRSVAVVFAGVVDPVSAGYVAEDFRVLHFRLMVKRGLSIRRRSAAWTNLLDWTYRLGNQHLHCG